MQFLTGMDNNTQDNMLRMEAVDITEKQMDEDNHMSHRLSLRSEGSNKNRSGSFKNGYAALGNDELEIDAQN